MSPAQPLSMTEASSFGATVLRAGALTATLDGADLAHIRLGATELIRRILVTVRDTDWDTLQPQVLSSTILVDGERFEISVEGQHVAAGLKFSWHLSIRAEATGRLVYELDGHAGSEFDYARIGLCVLHPVETCAGATYRASSSGTSYCGRLALDITPQVIADGVPIALFPACDALELRPVHGGELDLAFTGDLFEMEDQRNWTDDSFKTYCTPASLGFPHHASSGQKFRQSVEVRADGFDIAVLEPGRPVTVEIGSPSGRSMPALGLGMSSDLQVPGDEDRALRRLGLAHVRADVQVDGALPSSLERAIATCHQTEAALELALHLELSDERRLGEIGRALCAGDVPIARVLAFHRLARSETVTEATSAELVTMVRRLLGDLAPVGGGTNMDFAELNRRRPDPEALGIAAWSMNAQVHASDDASVMETVRGQAATVATARVFCGACTFALGPITLKPRFNPAASDPPVTDDPDDIPSHVDPRQATPFAAAWTARSIAGLAASGVASLTYFELVGLAGVMHDRTSPPHPKLPAGADSLFPCYYVFEALAPLHGKQLLDCHVSAGGDLAALATAERVVVANLTPTPQTAVITGLQWCRAGERTELTSYGVSVLEPGASRG
jgi:D-apionolactonase